MAAPSSWEDTGRGTKVRRNRLWHIIIEKPPRLPLLKKHSPMSHAQTPPTYSAIYHELLPTITLHWERRGASFNSSHIGLELAAPSPPAPTSVSTPHHRLLAVPMRAASGRQLTTCTAVSSLPSPLHSHRIGSPGDYPSTTRHAPPYPSLSSTLNSITRS